MLNDGSPDPDLLVQLRALVLETARANATSCEQLARMTAKLSEVSELVDRLEAVKRALQPITDQLSEMTLDTARRVWRADRAGAPFLDLVRQLDDLARHVDATVADLEGELRRAALTVADALAEARHAHAQLQRMSASLQAVISTPPPLPQDRVVAFELKVDRTQTGDKQQKPPSIFDVWPAPLDSDGRSN